MNRERDKPGPRKTIFSPFGLPPRTRAIGCTHLLDSAVIAREGGRSSNRHAIITGCPAFAGHDGPILQLRAGNGLADTISQKKIFLETTFSLNACVGNVFAVSQSCDSCRIHGHLLNDRAPIARDTTQNIFLHERSACTPSCIGARLRQRIALHTDQEKQKEETPGSQPDGVADHGYPRTVLARIVLPAHRR